MTDQEIIDMIKTLERSVSKEGAEAAFLGFGEVALYANKQGYLRMTLELMKCACDETYLDADMNYLFGKDSDFGIEHFVRDQKELDFFIK